MITVDDNDDDGDNDNNHIKDMVSFGRSGAEMRSFGESLSRPPNYVCSWNYL